MSSHIEELNSSNKQITIKKDYHKGDKNLVLLFVGSIDTYNSNDVSKAILGSIEEEAPKILILDLGGVNYVASTGIGSITLVLKKCREKDIHLYLVNINDKVFEVFNLLGFTSFFTIVDSYDEAVDQKKESTYPKVLECPSCNAKLKIPKSGRFKCKSCSRIISADREGNIILSEEV